MEELIKLAEKIHPTATRFFINHFLVTLFWFIPFILFKEEFLGYSFHIQMILVFCVSLAWYFVSCIINVILFNIFNLVDKYGYYLLELTTIFGILFLCVLINIGYYYSFTITKFLQISFIPLLVLPFIIFLLVELLLLTLKGILKLQKKQNN